MSSPWSPEQYERFKGERSRPFIDLARMLHRDDARGGRMLDLGCGTGELTAWLHGELGAAETLGIDRSETMLAKTREHEAAGLSFRNVAIEELVDSGEFDVVLANASLHWIDDHPRLFERLAALLRPGGQLAVQVPANHDHVSHLVAAQVAAEEPFESELGGWVRRSPVLPPEEYARLLFRMGFVEQAVEQRVYAHELDSRDGVAEWMKGTTLLAYRSRLAEESYERFLVAYGERLREQLLDERPFLFTFKRTFVWGRRASSA